MLPLTNGGTLVVFAKYQYLTAIRASPSVLHTFWHGYCMDKLARSNMETMKAAFSCWGDRIAPVFDTARQLHVVEIVSGRIVSERREPLAQDQPLQKIQRLVELGMGELVCGAISAPLQAMIADRGIQVVPFVAGDLQEVIPAWLKGGLRQKAFAMPGCFRRARRHWAGFDNNFLEVGNMNGKGRGGGGAGGGRGQMGGGRGAGRGPGRGRMGGPLGAGAVGNCVCPKCGQRVAHERGMPCVQRQCPQCGTALIRE
jgi:predicted Fe-Mo cluster-binding NifX family protein